MNAKLKKFLDEKGITEEGFKAKDAEELAGLYVEYNEKLAESLEILIAKKATNEDVAESIKSLKTEMEEARAEQLKHLNATLKEFGEQIKSFAKGNRAPSDSDMSLSEQIKKGLEANKEKLKALKEGSLSEASAAKFKFDITGKAAAPMTIAANVSGGNVPVEDRLEGFNTIPSRRVRLLDVMNQRTTTSNVVSWVYQANKDGAAGQTAEGTAKNQIEFDLVVDNATVKKTTAYIKVSTEMLDDIEWIQTEIQNELMRELLKKVEEQAFSGDGLANNHLGITTVASAFVAGSFAGTIDNANIVDVLVASANQIEVAQEGDALANYIFMHPNDVTSLKFEKVSSTDKRYVERLIQVGSTLFMDGIPIIKTTLVTEGEYLIGAFDLAILVTRSGMTFDIGFDGNDFTNNLRTILAEWRGLTIVKQNDRSAFVTGVFATDIDTLRRN